MSRKGDLYRSVVFRRRANLGDFFFIALFFSIYRSRIRLQAISELGHLSIRRMRQDLFASAGCDSAVDEAADRAVDEAACSRVRRMR
jgi:hypothetical protein